MLKTESLADGLLNLNLKRSCYARPELVSQIGVNGPATERGARDPCVMCIRTGRTCYALPDHDPGCEHCLENGYRCRQRSDTPTISQEEEEDQAAAAQDAAIVIDESSDDDYADYADSSDAGNLAMGSSRLPVLRPRFEGRAMLKTRRRRVSE